MRTDIIGTTRLLYVPEHGAPLCTGQDALDLIGDAWSSEAALIVVPVGRFAPSFFDLSTGQAGEFLQKLVNYRLRLAVVGDLTAQVSRSDALRDFVRESNRGGHIWFLENTDQLSARLRPAE